VSAERITIRLNGAEKTLPEGCTLDRLLADLKLHPSQVAAELQGEIVPKSMYDKTILADGQVLEIVRMVGGG